MGVLQIIGGFKGGGIGPFILGGINVLVGILLLGSRSQQRWLYRLYSACCCSFRARD